ncbi:MAG: hypothetical protein JXB47_20605 [Anaerolineae bacterium]|nr:hypothetical protein [Anaerolineae bacterium]
MAKRQNRLRPIDHEIRQLESLKTLEPITTPDEYLVLSEELIDIAVAALREVYALEEGEHPDPARLDDLYQRVYLVQEMARS